MIELAHFAAFLALGLSLAQAVLGLKGERRLAGLSAIARGAPRSRLDSRRWARTGEHRGRDRRLPP